MDLMEQSKSPQG